SFIGVLLGNNTSEGGTNAGVVYLALEKLEVAFRLKHCIACGIDVFYAKAGFHHAVVLRSRLGVRLRLDKHRLGLSQFLLSLLKLCAAHLSRGICVQSLLIRDSSLCSQIRQAARIGLITIHLRRHRLHLRFRATDSSLGMANLTVCLY